MRGIHWTEMEWSNSLGRLKIYKLKSSKIKLWSRQSKGSKEEMFKTRNNWTEWRKEIIRVKMCWKTNNKVKKIVNKQRWTKRVGMTQMKMMTLLKVKHKLDTSSTREEEKKEWEEIWNLRVGWVCKWEKPMHKRIKMKKSSKLSLRISIDL